MQIFKVDISERSIFFIDYDYEELKNEFSGLATSISEVKKIIRTSNDVIIAINQTQQNNSRVISEKIQELFIDKPSNTFQVNLYRNFSNEIVQENVIVDKKFTRLYSTKSVKQKPGLADSNQFFSYLMKEVIKSNSILIRAKNNEILSIYKKHENLKNVSKSLVNQDLFKENRRKTKGIEQSIYYTTLFFSLLLFLIRFKIDKSVFSWDPSSLAEYTYMMSRSFATINIDSFSQTLQSITPNRGPLIVLLAWPLLSMTYGFSELIVVMLFNVIATLCILILMRRLVNMFYPKAFGNAYSVLGLSAILFNSAFLLYVTTEFWTEPIQILTITSSLLLIAMHLQNKITSKLFFSYYLIVLFFVLLGKLSLIVFPVINLIIYIALRKVFKIKQFENSVKFKPNFSLKLIALYVIVFMLILQGLYWMYFNFYNVFIFSKDAALGSISKIYGSDSGFLSKLFEWVALLIDFFTNKFLFMYIAALFLLAFFSIANKYLRNRNISILDVYVVFLFLSCIAGITVLSFQNGFNVRFLAPIFANFVLLTYFLVRNTSRGIDNNYKKISIWSPIFYFGIANVLNWLGLVSLPFAITPIIKLQEITNEQFNLTQVINVTCESKSDNSTSLIVFDVEELNYNNLNFYANTSLYPKNLCRYSYLGFNIQDWNFVKTRIDSAEEDFLISYNLQTQDIPLEPDFNNYFVREIDNYLENNPKFELIDVIDSKFNIYLRIE
jgi:hypothetical protein